MELEKLKKIIAEVLNVDENEITEETRFTDDLGADSLDVFQIKWVLRRHSMWRSRMRMPRR